MQCQFCLISCSHVLCNNTLCNNINNQAVQLQWAVNSLRSPSWCKHTALCQTSSAVWTVFQRIQLLFVLQLWCTFHCVLPLTRMNEQSYHRRIAFGLNRRRHRSQSAVFLTHVCCSELSNTHCTSMTEIWTPSNCEFMAKRSWSSCNLTELEPFYKEEWGKTAVMWMCKADRDSRL